MGKRGMKPKDYTGLRFGKLVVINELPSVLGKHGRMHRRFACRCDCGKQVNVYQTALTEKGKSNCTICIYGNKSREEIMGRSLLRQYKNGAKKRGILFTISDAEFFSIIKTPCYYCGKFRCRRNIHTKEEFYNFNGVDRIDSLKGYTAGNVVPCCTYCNQAKNSREPDEFLVWVNDLYDYQMRKKLEKSAKKG